MQMKKHPPLEKKAMGDIQALLAGTAPVEEVLGEMHEGRVSLDSDPEFVWDCLKGQFVEDMLNALKAKNWSPTQLAKKMGKSRQYVCRILDEQANFTFKTIAEIACALELRVDARMFPRDERMAILPAVSKPRLLVLEDFVSQADSAESDLGGHDAGHFAA